MNVARKNIQGLIKTLEEEQTRGMVYMNTLVTKNYGTDCISFTTIDTVIEQLKQTGQINLNWRGVWNSKQNNLDFSDCIGNIHDLYALARAKKYID